MQIRLLTTINYGNIGAYSDKMLHSPNPCTRLHAAVCRGDSEEKEEGGVILVHSKGPFQEGCKGGGAGGGGDPGGNQNLLSVLLTPTPTLPGSTELAEASAPKALEGSRLRCNFFNVCFLVTAHPPAVWSLGQGYVWALSSLSSCHPPYVDGLMSTWHPVGDPLPQYKWKG